MDSTTEFTKPAAKIEKPTRGALPCPFTAKGMLQPSHLQPPPMFGPRGTTIPPKFLPSYKPTRMEPHPSTPPPTPQQQINNNPNNYQQKFNNSYQQRSDRTQNHHHQHQQQYNQFKKHNNDQNNKSRFNNPSKSTTNHNFHKKNQNYTNNDHGTKEFCCEPCDRDFSTIIELNEHKNQHKKCTIDDCKFEGHEKLVENHIQMQHATGLYDKIRKLNTPEEITAWREERRKKYPIKKNIELRQKMQDQRIKRGEKLEDSKKRFGRKEDCRRGGGGGQKNDDQQKLNSQKQQQKKRKRKRNRNVEGGGGNAGDVTKSGVENKINIDGDDEDSDSPKKFAGTSQIIDYERPNTKPTQNSLSGLIGMYDSSENDGSNSDIDNEIVNIRPIIQLSTNKPDDCTTITKLEEKPPSAVENIEVNLEKEEIDEEINENDDPPDEEMFERHTELIIEEQPQLPLNKNPNSSKILEPPSKKMKKSDTIFDLSKKYRNQNTMLEKLLQKDIRHERNVLLQCVRYVVENNFFGIGSNDQKKPLN